MTSHLGRTSEGAFFTAVVPVHDGAEFLNEALESITAQTFIDWECLIVDDASSDGSCGIAAAWAAKQRQRVQILPNVNGKSRGVAASRNRGIELASTAWIAFLDQDDIWYPTKLEKQAGLIRCRPDLPALGCFPDILFDGIEPLPFLERWAEMIWSMRDRQPCLVSLEDFVSGCPFCLSGVVARRGALIREGGFDPSLVRTSDWMMWAQMASRGPLGLMPDKLVTYRVHGGNEMFKITDQPLGLTAAFLEMRSRVGVWLAKDRFLTCEQASAFVDDLICKTAVNAKSSSV